MTVQQILLTSISSILSTLSLYHFFMALFVSVKKKQYLYFSISTFGGAMFSFFALLLTFSDSPGSLVIYHRLRMLGLMIGTSSWFFLIYGLYFADARVPKIYFRLSLICGVTVPTSLFLSLPIHELKIQFAGAVFQYRFATMQATYSLYALIIVIFFSYSFLKILRCRDSVISKYYGAFAFIPGIIGGINDFAIIHGFLKSIMLSEYLFFSYLLSVFVFFLKQKQQDYTTLHNLNLKLEEEVQNRTKELTAANELLNVGIAEHTRAEEEMKRSKEFLDNIIESSQDCIFVTDNEGFITRVNSSFLRMVGYTNGEVNRKHIIDFTPCEPGVFETTAGESIRLSEEFIKTINTMMGRLFNNGKLENWTTYFLGKDKKIIPVEANIVLLFDETGKIIGCVGVLRDVTDIKKAEQRALVSQKMASIGVLAGSIANDFNNLLFKVMGNVSLAKDNAALDPDALNFLSEAGKALSQASKLTREFIIFSTGGEPVKETTGIEGLIHEVVDRVLNGSKVSCSYSFEDDVCPVEIDKSQVSHVFRDIVENAKEAMPLGGEINIRGEVITQHSKNSCEDLPLKDGAYLKICIRDNGTGIPVENLKNIFDPYFSTKLRGTQKGMGLGLSIAYSIIKKHDGFIHVESVEGEGTEVYIYLPAHPREAGSADKNNKGEQV